MCLQQLPRLCSKAHADMRNPPHASHAVLPAGQHNTVTDAPETQKVFGPALRTSSRHSRDAEGVIYTDVDANQVMMRQRQLCSMMLMLALHTATPAMGCHTAVPQPCRVLMPVLTAGRGGWVKGRWSPRQGQAPAGACCDRSLTLLRCPVPALWALGRERARHLGAGLAASPKSMR